MWSSCHGPLPAEVPAQFRGLAIPGLYILVTFIDGVGEFDASVRIYDPKGNALGPESRLKAKLEKGEIAEFDCATCAFPRHCLRKVSDRTPD